MKRSNYTENRKENDVNLDTRNFEENKSNVSFKKTRANSLTKVSNSVSTMNNSQKDLPEFKNRVPMKFGAPIKQV